jgi:multiple sugar transport system permease protein
MLDDRRFWSALTNSAYYTLLYVPASMGVALFVAVILNRLKGSYFFRTLFFMPVISSWVAVSVVWITLLDPRAGILNYLLSLFGIPPVNWLGEPSNAMPTVVLISVWKNVGFLMVIWLAGLQAVPQELYEAAAIDGASRFQRFLYVTLPLLRPTTFFLTVTGIIGSFQVFSPVYVITGGGPRGATDVVVYRIYVRAFEGLDFGYASAQSWVLFLIIFGLTVVQFWYRRRNEEQVI